MLIIDDSVVVRKVLDGALAGDPALSFRGTAPDGHVGLAKIPQLNPDLITLDVEMPGMSGIEVLKEIRKSYPRLPVIMFSTLTERGAETTIEALSLGASDYVTKPSNTGSLDITLKRIREELIPKIKVLCREERTTIAPAMSVASSVAPPKVPAPRISRPFDVPIEILAIGCSTGGPNALAEILPELPASLPVPVVIVQHMPPLFTQLLAKRLDAQSELSIHEAQAGAVLEPGHAWFAPGDFHMTVERQEMKGQIALNQQPPENFCRPAVDVLFRSVANTFGANVLAVVLTGMGSDGVRGAETLRESGAHVLVQDEASSVVWGMPGQVAAAGLADEVIPLDQIASRIEHLVSRSRAATRTSAPLRSDNASPNRRLWSKRDGGKLVP